MASRKAALAALTLLSRAFAGEVSGEKADVYAAAVEDLTDEQLMTATARVIKTRTDDFLPPPAVILEAAGANVEPVLDAERILREIEAAGTYTPSGWSNLRERQVRERFGDVIADAYSEAGCGTRLFSSNETTRDIAFREFQLGLKVAIHTHGVQALPGWAVPKRVGGSGARGLLGSGASESPNREIADPASQP